MVYYDPRKPKPWPIRLLNNIGITNDTTATNIIIVISILLLLGTGYLLFQANAESTAARDLTPEQLRQLGI